MKRIGLREARRRRRLTQTELASRIGKRQNFISRLENGLVEKPSFHDVIALAHALEIDPLRLRFDQALAS